MVAALMNDKPTAVRTALLHVEQGRARVQKQAELIERLHVHGHPTEEAEKILEWMMTTQKEFESHYRLLLEEGQQKLQESGWKDPKAGLRE